MIQLSFRRLSASYQVPVDAERVLDVEDVESLVLKTHGSRHVAEALVVDHWNRLALTHRCVGHVVRKLTALLQRRHVARI